MVRGGGAGTEATVSIMGSGHMEIPPRTDCLIDIHRTENITFRMKYVCALITLDLKFGYKRHLLSASNLFCIFSLFVKRDQWNSQILSIRYQQLFITRNQLMCTLNG